MTKEEILAAAGFDNTPEGIKAFYNKFKSKEDFDAYMKNGGSLSGAPHNGQPTAQEYFKFGNTTNLNIPFGNFAKGGTPCMECGGYMDEGGNTASPMNYGAFPVMDHGGFMEALNSVSKEQKQKASKNTVIQGGNDLNPGQKMMAQFKNKLAQNFQTSLIKDTHNEFMTSFMQMGGQNFNTGFDYKNQAIQNMYQTKIDQGEANLKNDANDLFFGISYLNSPENQYNKTTITKAQYGMPTGPNLKGGLSPEQLYALHLKQSYVPDNTRKSNTSTSQSVGSQQQNPVPAAYANYYLQEYQHKHFGPWGKTRMTFGTNFPNAQGYNQGQNFNQGPYSDHRYNPFQPATEDAGANSSESWFSKWRAVQQAKAESKARRKKYNNRPEETQTGLNAAVYDYEQDMPDEYNPKKMTNWDWYNPDTPEMEFGGPMYQFAGAVQYDVYGNPIDPNKQMMRQNTFGSTSSNDMFGQNNIFKGEGQRNTFGTPKPQQSNNGFPQGNSSFTIQNKYGPNLGGPAAASTLLAGVNTIASAIENSQDDSEEKMGILTLADNAKVKTPLNAQSRGRYEPNSGVLMPDQYVVTTQFGGELDLPIAREGLDLKAGLYGTNGNRQFSLPNQIQSSRFSEPLTETRGTLEPVERSEANVEAEEGERAVININNLPTNFKIGGEKHSKGGTPLNVPDDSFIFSDTASMVIKDPIMLVQFGMVPKKSGYTPAEIAKKYDINKFRQVLANPDSEDLERKTAELMIANYNMKLAKLALLQESMKGFPQGIPKMAMPYVEASKMNPEELIQNNMQGQTDSADADMGVAKFGGNIHQKLQDGGIAEAIAYLKDKNIQKEKKETWNKNYQEALKKGYAELENNKALLKAAEIKDKAKKRADQIIQEELKRKEARIKKLTKIGTSGKEQFGLMTFPTGNIDAKLEKELQDYIIYKNKFAPETINYDNKNTSLHVPSKEEMDYYKTIRKSTKPVEQKAATNNTQTNQQPKDIEIKRKPVKPIKSTKTDVDTFYVDDLSDEEKALLGLK